MAPDTARTAAGAYALAIMSENGTYRLQVGVGRVPGENLTDPPLEAVDRSDQVVVTSRPVGCPQLGTQLVLSVDPCPHGLEVASHIRVVRISLDKESTEIINEFRQGHVTGAEAADLGQHGLPHSRLVRVHGPFSEDHWTPSSTGYSSQADRAFTAPVAVGRVTGR